MNGSFCPWVQHKAVQSAPEWGSSRLCFRADVACHPDIATYQGINAPNMGFAILSVSSKLVQLSNSTQLCSFSASSESANLLPRDCCDIRYVLSFALHSERTAPQCLCLPPALRCPGTHLRPQTYGMSKLGPAKTWQRDHHFT